MLMADPKQRFVVNTVTREQIAEALTEHCQALGHDVTIEGTDERLTDATCEGYAGLLGTLNEDESDYDEQVDALLHELAERLGLLP